MNFYSSFTDCLVMCDVALCTTTFDVCGAGIVPNYYVLDMNKHASHMSSPQPLSSCNKFSFTCGREVRRRRPSALAIAVVSSLQPT